MMNHFSQLEKMYLNAPLHQFYDSLQVKISDGSAEITLVVDKKYFHAAGATHGSVLFKLLDDAAFFAAQSLEQEYFLLTSTFNTQFLRPVTSGKIIAKGKVKAASKNLIVAEATISNEQGKEIAFGTGNFLKSGIMLKNLTLNE
jgi:uncharacterized protein (TIGR00369 family)